MSHDLQKTYRGAQTDRIPGDPNKDIKNFIGKKIDIPGHFNVRKFSENFVKEKLTRKSKI